MRKHAIAAVIAILIVLLLPLSALAQSDAPFASQAETIRSELTQAQLALLTDPAAARQHLHAAQQLYTDALGPALAAAAPAADARARSGFAAAARALVASDKPGFAAARADIWTSLLAGGYDAVAHAIQAGDGRTAQLWLPLREFRTATKFSRPNSDATLAITGLAAGRVNAAGALQALRADLLDTYQARLTAALHDLAGADQAGYAARRAEFVALAQGYFAILAPTYAEQRGTQAMGAAERAFADLRAEVLAEQPSQTTQTQVEQMLRGFRAAPLDPAEQIRRAGQMLRFLSLVPVEYQRGVSGGVVIKDLEIREATTFRAGAAAAFADLRTVLERQDTSKTEQVARLFDTLDQQLLSAGKQTQVADPDLVQATSDQIGALLSQIMPAEWQQHDSAADFDVISTALDQMQAAITAGDYGLAESARLEAYAILESGPEAKLIVFAPQHKAPLEDLFWYGQGEQKGLAYLIGQLAPAAEITASRKALDAELAAAQAALVGNNAPVSVASNAAIIVFREGLEAVLILASLMGSLKLGEQRRFRRPLWWGAVGALLASALTWLLARGLLSSLARYGERLEAIVSLIAIGVLLLITNWFFHKVYWNGWIANFHTKKRKLIGGSVGQWLGLALLGFTSIYREGFETVLFLQALVLEAGAGVVLSGVALGLGGTLLVGFIVFALQSKLPYKKMLIVTGVMIGVVLLQMVGNTIHVMQVVGWMSIHPLRWLELPYWLGMWFGLYATWEGIGFQVGAAVFVIGSYLLAEHVQHRQAKQPQAHAGANPAVPQRPIALREKESNSL